ncbi:MAG: glycosyltransferase, partial [Microcystis sp.]
MPKVTVCIPTYNRADYLTYSINSVLRQTYEDFELIVCDDGSSDRTPEVVAAFQDSRIIYLRHPQNMGRSLNMRSGFTAAQGEYFIKFDDDDGLTPEFLAKTVPILDQEKNVDFVCTDHWIIDKFGQKVTAATQENSAKWGKDRLQQGIIPDLQRQTFFYQSLQVGSTLFRYQSLADVDYMRPQADGCEDFDLLVRLALCQSLVRIPATPRTGPRPVLPRRMSVELRSASKRFGDAAAVDQVSFSVADRELVALLGPSGGGKTTFLRMIAGLESPTSGDLFLQGRRVNEVPVQQRNIGFVFQNYALFPTMTVFDNIAFGLRVRKWKTSDSAARVEELLGVFGLGGLARRFPHQ